LTTVQQRIVPGGAAGFDQLLTGPGEGYVVREDGPGAAYAGRESRRRSLAYFGQISDFQLADEESPARVEFLDLAGSPVEAAFRPWEALEPFIDDARSARSTPSLVPRRSPRATARGRRWGSRSTPATRPTASS